MRFTTVVAFLMALAVGGLLLLHGFGFMAGFNTTPLPALSELVKAGQELAGKAEPRGRVVVVLVDGLRADYAEQLAPKVPAGVPFASCQLETILPSFSRPAYVALSTGVPPWASGVHTNDHEGPSLLPSIWDVARRAGIRTQLVSDGTDWWTALFPEGFDQIDIVAKKDFDAFWNAMPPMHPKSLVLVHIVAPDDAGHDFGVGVQYRAEVARAGEKIQRLIGELGPDDTLIVTADHGHIDRGGHGGPEPETMAIPLLAFGAGVVSPPAAVAAMPAHAGGRHGEVWCGTILDIPVAVAARLDLPPPRAGLGGLPPIITPANPAFSALLATQSVAVHDTLGAGKHDPFAHGRQRAASLRGALIAIALWLGLWFLVAWGLVVGPRPRSLVSALVPPFLFVCAYMIFEPTLSLSAVWLEDPWTQHLGLIAAGAALIANVVVFRRHAPAEALMLVALGGLLPFMIAGLAHGSLAAGPVLGEPHAAFAILAADLYAGVTMAVALVVAAIAFARERRRARAKVWV